MATNHTYVKTHTLSSPAISFSLSAEYESLYEKAVEAKSRRAGKTLVKEGSLRVTLIALLENAELSAHQVEGAVSIQVARGRARIAADSEIRDLETGDVIVLDREVTHTVEALADCGLLITVAMSAAST